MYAPWALASRTSDMNPYPNLQALQQRAEELSSDLSAQQKQELADAFKNLGYFDLAQKASP